MQDHRSRGEEYGLATEGAYLSETEIKELSKGSKHSNMPEEGVARDPHLDQPHAHKMPEGNIQLIDEEGRRIL
jgi:hypothetical protein